MEKHQFMVTFSDFVKTSQNGYVVTDRGKEPQQPDGTENQAHPHAPSSGARISRPRRPMSPAPRVMTRSPERTRACTVPASASGAAA